MLVGGVLVVGQDGGHAAGRLFGTRSSPTAWRFHLPGHGDTTYDLPTGTVDADYTAGVTIARHGKPEDLTTALRASGRVFAKPHRPLPSRQLHGRIRSTTLA